MDSISASSPTKDVGQPSSPRLAVSLFGGFEARSGGEPVAIKNRKAQALLAYLLLSGPRSEPRERLCGLLWSESSEDKARASLRQTLHGLREAFDGRGFSGFAIARDEVGIAKTGLAVDAWSVLERAEHGEVHPLLLERKRLAETLLPGFEDLDPAFRVWLLVQRQALQEQVERSLETLLAKPGLASASLRAAASALLNLDPTHEEACRRLIEDHAEQGDTAAALKIYKRLWDLLDDEYGTEPSDRTKDLVVRIKSGEFEASRRASAPASEPAGAAPARRDAAKSPAEEARTFLVIADFDSGGLQPALAPLVQGLRHDLIAKLIRFRDWSVLDGKGLAGDLLRDNMTAARCFSIDVTLIQAGAGVNLILTLKEQARYVWSESFALELDRWFEIQQSLVRRIALALNVHLSAERLNAAARRPDISVGAFDRWLRGHQHVLNFRPADWSRAAQIFQSIIDEAPEFAPAYSGLAQIKNIEHIVFPGTPRLREREAQALALAKMATQNDPFDSRAHLSLAWAMAMSGHHDQAELNYGLALKLNENDPWTSTSAALGLAYCGRHEAAVGLADVALSLNLAPSKTHWGYQATLRFLCGDYAGCVDAAENAQEAIQNLPAWHAAALAHLGEMGRAEEKGRRLLEIIRGNWHASGPPTDEAISSWLLGAFPIRARADWERFRDGLLLAKMPIAYERA